MNSRGLTMLIHMSPKSCIIFAFGEVDIGQS